MKKLIENGDVILDGTETRQEKEKQVFAFVEAIQDLFEKYGIENLPILEKMLNDYDEQCLFTMLVYCYLEDKKLIDDYKKWVEIRKGKR